MSNVTAVTATATATDTDTARKPKKLRRLSTSGNITEKECTTSVTERVKYYDKACKGLYVDISPTSPATFWVKCTTNEGKLRPIKVGRFHATELTIVRAREIAEVLKVKVSQGQDVVAERQAARIAVRDGLTVDQVIELRIAYISEDEPRKCDGALRSRRRNWQNVARHLRNYVSPRLGTKMIRNVTRQQIVDMDKAIKEGTLILADGTPCKASKSNRRHVRCAVSAMFKWAAQEGHVDGSPCVNLPQLDHEPSRDRVLTDDEIRTLWHGLDRPDMPWDRRICLGLKFALATMLRSWELLGAHKNELAMHDDATPCIDVPADRVKKVRVINQPLTGLALDVLKESMGNYQYLFVGRFGDAPLSRQAMSGALKGTKKTVNGVRVTRSIGICELLGLAPFTPHDLRRTAATLAGRAGLSDQMIGYALDHQKENNKTTSIYNRAARKNMAEKRQVLEAVEAKLREIVGLNEAEMQRAA